MEMEQEIKIEVINEDPSVESILLNDFQVL